MTPQPDIESERVPVCCVCGDDLPRYFELDEEGRGHCPDCEPAPPPERPEVEVESLAEFAERKARSAMMGRGQTTLDA